MGYLEGKKVRLGEKAQYASIYGYQKFRYPVIDVETGQELGLIKEEVTPGIPGQPDIAVYYEKNRWRLHGKLRFYQSPEALVLALGGKIDTSRLSPPEPEPADKPIIRRTSETIKRQALGSLKKVPTVRRKKTAKPVRQKALKKPARKASARKAKPGARKRKVKAVI
jgi:hypothetical protein